MFNNLLSKLAVVAATAVVGLGAVTAPAHAFGKTLSGEFGADGMTFSGSFEGEDKSGGGVIELEELTAFTMNFFAGGETVYSLGLNDLENFAYLEKGVPNWIIEPGSVYMPFWNGFSFNSFSSSSDTYINMGIYDYKIVTEKEFEYKYVSFSNLLYSYSSNILQHEIGDLQSVPESNSQSVPEPASMLGLLAVGAAGISTFKKKKASRINTPSPELTRV